MLSRNLIVVFLVITCSSYAQQPGQVIVHVPVLISAGDKYYLFATGDGIDVWSSTDLENWSKQAPVFPESPAWAKREVPTFNAVNRIKYLLRMEKLKWDNKGWPLLINNELSNQ